MLPIETLLTYTAACIAIVIVPGPTVTVIIANSLRRGASAGLLNVAGTQVGLSLMLVALALGLSTIINHMEWVFDWLRLVGAAYLIWLGVKLWRADGAFKAGTGVGGHRAGQSYFWQGFLVVWSNPKALLLFGAFIPQFLDPSGNMLAQTLTLGLIAIATATICDSSYAFAAGRAGHWLTGAKVRWLERISGSFLIGGGLWLALTRRT